MPITQGWLNQARAVLPPKRGRRPAGECWRGGGGSSSTCAAWVSLTAVRRRDELRLRFTLCLTRRQPRPGAAGRSAARTARTHRCAQDPREPECHGRSWIPVHETSATQHLTPPLHSEPVLTCLSDGFGSFQRTFFFPLLFI